MTRPRMEQGAPDVIGARETVAMLLTDIAGSTRLWRAAPEQMADALKRHDELVGEVAARYGGVRPPDQGEGDSRFLAFDAAGPSVEAALALQRALHRERWPTPQPLGVRIGVHAGDVLRRGDNLLGEAVSRCARLRDVAHPGQVLLSSAIEAILRDDLPSGATVRDLGAHRLPDLTQPERIFQLCHHDLPEDFPPLNSLEATTHNLPVQLSSFVGRTEEVAAVAQLVEDCRLVTITGFGGVGKTRLALQVAGHVAASGADGTYFVDLSALRDPTLLLDAIAAALDVSPGESRHLLPALGRRLSGDRVLLVLDNLEQVVAAAPALVELLGAAPGLRLLATSREPLRLRGEREYALEPLSVPDERSAATPLTTYGSVELFIDRAQSAVAGFEVDNDTAPAIAAICARLDGLPLAIELAAARVRVLPPKALLARLADRIDLPGVGARDLPHRHQTLRATIEWSFELLDADEQSLLAALSVFSGGASLDAVDGVCGAEFSDAVALLASLVGKSLVRQRRDLGDEPRYEMFQTVREFAVEQLAKDPLRATAVAERHAEHFRDAVAALVVDRFTEGPAVAFVQRELDNLRAALDQLRRAGRTQDEAQLLADMADAAWHRGHWDELIRRSVDLLDRMDRPSETSFTLLDCVAVGSLTSDLDRAEEWSRQAIAEAAALGRPVLEGRSWVWLAHLHQLRGELDEAEAAVRRGLALAEGAGDDEPRYRFYSREVALCEGTAIEAGLAIRRAQWNAAAVAAERALARAADLGDADSRIRGRVRVGGAALGAGRLDAASASFADAVDLCRGSGVRGYLPLLLAQLAEIERRRGDLASAQTQLAEATDVATELGVHEPLVDLVAADCALDAGDVPGARRALARASAPDIGESAVRAAMVKARLALADGDLNVARRRAASALGACVDQGLMSGVSSLLRLGASSLDDDPPARDRLLAAATAHEHDPGPVFLRDVVSAPAPQAVAVTGADELPDLIALLER